MSEPAERTVRKSLTTGAARLSVDAPRTSLSGGVARAEPSTLSPKKAKIARRASDVAAEGGASPVKRALSPVREKKAAGLSESEQAEASFVKALKKKHPEAKLKQAAGAVFDKVGLAVGFGELHACIPFPLP